MKIAKETKPYLVITVLCIVVLSFFCILFFYNYFTDSVGLNDEKKALKDELVQIQTKLSDPLLQLINSHNVLSSEPPVINISQIPAQFCFEEKVMTFSNQYLAFEKLVQLLNAANELELNPLITLSHRTFLEQNSLTNSAYTLPGRSEHQGYLAVDIMTNGDYDAEAFMQTDLYAWLKDNAHNYGFILRYPKEKESVTYVAHEPWHYRYVGESYAKIMRENNWCLEEYIFSLNKRASEICDILNYENPYKALLSQPAVDTIVDILAPLSDNNALPQTEPATTEPTEPKTDKEAELKRINELLESPLLRIVNRNNPIESSYVPELVTIDPDYCYRGAEKFCHPDAVDDLNAMMQAIREAGIEKSYVMLCYRSYKTQQSTYNTYVNNLTEEGMSLSKASEQVRRSTPKQGESENQLGLLFSICDSNEYGIERFQQTDLYAWLIDHAHEYGFILRFPDGKFEQTGLDFIPWSFRYVGKEAAAEIKEKGYCLEEYVEYLNQRKAKLEE